MSIRNIVTTSLFLLCSLGQTNSASAQDPTNQARESLKKYFQAWSEPDTSTRGDLLKSAWAEKGTYTDPTAHVKGRDALNKHIGQFLSNPQFKGSTIVQASEIDFHHQAFRFQWKLMGPSGTPSMTGMDYGEFDEDGKIIKIVGFFGPFRELK